MVRNIRGLLGIVRNILALLGNGEEYTGTVGECSEIYMDCSRIVRNIPGLFENGEEYSGTVRQW